MDGSGRRFSSKKRKKVILGSTVERLLSEAVQEDI
jgi:hypothetical protein